MTGLEKIIKGESDSDLPLELFLDSFLQSPDAGIIMSYPKMEVVAITAGAINLLGYNLKDYKTGGIELIIPDIHKSLHSNYVNKYETSGDYSTKVGKTRNDLEAVNSNGEIIPIDIGVSRCVTKNEEIYFRARIHDISYYKNLEKELKQISDNKDLFLGMIAHDISGAPLNAIIGYSQFVREDPNSTFSVQVIEGLKIIEQQGFEIRNIVESLSNLAQVTTGNYEPKLSPFQLGDFFSERYLHFKNTSFKQILVPDLGEISFIVEGGEGFNSSIMTDRGAYDRIFSNIIGNAIKYNVNGGEINISVNQSSDTKNLEFFITNTTSGGIPQEKYESIFNPYSRVDNQRDKIIKGAGLGLYISKLFVEALGGEISVTSQMGKSVESKIILPYTPSSINPANKGFKFLGEF